MNRIDKTFAELKAAGRKGLVGYLTAGDPTLEQSEANIREALTAGLDVLELGVPFSDPTADGPTIQAAAKRALESGATLRGVLEMVTRLRADFETPIVLFGYANPFLAYGYDALCRDAVAAGVDGFLVVDLPYEEAPELKQFADAAGLHFIPLVAPTTPPERMAEILGNAGGFVYYIMVTGVTGARTAMAEDVAERVALVRGATTLPIAVGFGVSNGEQAAQVAEGADAVVVGSALVKAASEGHLGALVAELAGALGGEERGVSL
jgi:tryptophan synthase alpha chain